MFITKVVVGGERIILKGVSKIMALLLYYVCI